MQVNVLCLQLDPKAQFPRRATADSAGLDLRTTEELVINPGETVLAPTGIAIAIMNPCVGMFILPRSGLASKGIVVANSPGLVDADYRGEIKVALRNTTDRQWVVAQGDRVAQCVFLDTLIPNVEYVSELPPSTRGVGGFGSTGVG